MRKSLFSMVDVLVVVAILVLVASITVPKIGGPRGPVRELKFQQEYSQVVNDLKSVLAELESGDGNSVETTSRRDQMLQQLDQLEAKAEEKGYELPCERPTIPEPHTMDATDDDS